MTQIDQAHAEMMANPGDDAARLRFYAALSDAELVLLLDHEAEEGSLAPKVFDLEEGPVVVAFDSEERLAEFAGETSPYAALPGRVIVDQLAGQGIGLGINLGVALSETLLPPDALQWLADTLARAPVAAEARPTGFSAPKGLPERLITALQDKIAMAAGLTRGAMLVGVTYDSGRRGHMMVFLDVGADSQPALARMVSEALTFSGIEAGELDVAFLDNSDPTVALISASAIRIQAPSRQEAEVVQRSGPGTDPLRPPILR